MYYNLKKMAINRQRYVFKNMFNLKMWKKRRRDITVEEYKDLTGQRLHTFQQVQPISDMEVKLYIKLIQSLS